MCADHREAVGLHGPEDQPGIGVTRVLGPRLSDWIDRVFGPGELLAAVVVAVHLISGALAVLGGADPWHAWISNRSLGLRVAVGGQYAPLVAAQPWRLVTCVLLHVDLLHLVLNAFAVLALGRALEVVIGRFRVVAWFCGTGVAGAVLTHLAGARQSDGASGGAFGLLAAGVTIALLRGASLEPRDRRLLGPVFGTFLALNLVLSFLIPAIDPIAHLGGAAAGAVWAALPDSRPGRWFEAFGTGLFIGACTYGWWLGAL